LNPLFWALDEAAVVSKFEALNRRPPDDPGIAWFAAVEDWASSGAPLPLPAARDLFLHGFGANQIGRGLWRVRGQAIDPRRIAAPILDFGALKDRIVPPEARLTGDQVMRRDVNSGHVGMVVGSGAKAALWEPLSNWLQDG
jgi:polyhydroxyalkanoate synthase